MSRRWVAVIAALLIGGLVVLLRAQPPIEPAGRSNAPAAAPGVEAAASPPAIPSAVPIALVDSPPPPRAPVPVDVPPPARIPVVELAPITVPNHENVAGLARQLCARTAAGDAAGVAALFGPGWSGHIPMDELRVQCSGDPTLPLLADGEYGNALTVFGATAVRHWAAESGLDAAHCVGLHVGDGRVMACRDNAGQYYRLAVIDFSAPRPPESPRIPGPDE